MPKEWKLGICYRNQLWKSTVKMSFTVTSSCISTKTIWHPLHFIVRHFLFWKKNNNRFTYFFCRIFFLAIYNQSQTNGTQTLNICIRGMLFTALELCIWDYSNACSICISPALLYFYFAPLERPLSEQAARPQRPYQKHSSTTQKNSISTLLNEHDLLKLLVSFTAVCTFFIWLLRLRTP